MNTIGKRNKETELSQNIVKAKTMPVVVIDCTGPVVKQKVKFWTTDECLALIETYKSYLPYIHEQNIQPEHMWKLILSELGEGYAKKFTTQDLKFKIDDLKRAFSDLVSQNSIDVDEPRPLMSALGELIAAESSYQSVDNDELVEVEEDGSQKTSASQSIEPLRWLNSETWSLVKAYKKYLPRLLCCCSLQAKGAVWKQIASEVVLRAPLECTSNLARHRLYTLKSRYDKFRRTKKKTSWPFYTEMVNLVALESYLKKKVDDNVPLNSLNLEAFDAGETTTSMPTSQTVPDSDDDGDRNTDPLTLEAEPARPKRHRTTIPVEVAEDDENDEPAPPPPPKKPKKPIAPLELEDEDAEEPIWFTMYRDAAKKRHEEKMLIKNKLLDILEEVLQQM